jgi:hypothetical protein
MPIDLDVLAKCIAEHHNDPTVLVGHDTVHDVDISTVRLMVTPGGLIKKPTWETCLFFDDGDSRVVERYYTAEDAHKGHGEWIDKVLQGLHNT